MKKTIIISGAAGEGINTVEMFVEKIFKKAGYEIFAYKNYMSRIRGGFNYSVITVSDKPIYSNESKADFYVALNEKSFEAIDELCKNEATLIAMDELKKSVDESHLKNKEIVWLSGEEIRAIGKMKMGFGMVALGFLLKTFSIDEKWIDSIAHKKWPEAIRQSNQDWVKLGYEKGQKCIEGANPEKTKGKIVINGNQAVAMGAMSAGLGFYCAYPMAPSTGIMNTVALYQKQKNIMVEQAEDEIAAAMAAICAGATGVRAMTSTSGGGFSLMVESLGFAGVGEVPVVMCNVQRPGPATGLPTRTEQADLSFVVTASQGEFPRIVLAPTSIEEAFYTTFRAFDLAERFQLPVILLTDQLLADSVQSIPRFKTDDLVIHRYLADAEDKNYKRYQLDQIEGKWKYPRHDDQQIIMTDSHVHDEEGFITESEYYANGLKEKYLKRMEHVERALDPPKLYGDESYETLFIAWGSTYGALKDAVDELLLEGEKVAMLSFTDVYPLREDVLDPYIKKETTWIQVEGNGTNQFGKLLRMATGLKWQHAIQKYDGRPFTAEYIIKAYKEAKNG